MNLINGRKTQPVSIEKTVEEERCRFWNCLDQARKLIDRQQVWKLIIEAFKILKYRDPSDKYRTSFEVVDIPFVKSLSKCLLVVF